MSVCRHELGGGVQPPTIPTLAPPLGHGWITGFMTLKNLQLVLTNVVIVIIYNIGYASALDLNISPSPF